MDTPNRQTSRELSAAATEYAIQAKQDEERKLELAAQIAALQKQHEEILRKQEDYRLKEEAHKKAAKNQLFFEQRASRQEAFRGEITDHIVRGIRETASDDELLKSAIDLISNDQGTRDHFQVVRAGLTSELAGSGDDFIQYIADRVTRQTSYEDDYLLEQFQNSYPALSASVVRENLQARDHKYSSGVDDSDTVRVQASTVPPISKENDTSTMEGKVKDSAPEHITTNNELSTGLELTPSQKPVTDTSESLLQKFRTPTKPIIRSPATLATTSKLSINIPTTPARSVITPAFASSSKKPSVKAERTPGPIAGEKRPRDSSVESPTSGPGTAKKPRARNNLSTSRIRVFEQELESIAKQDGSPRSRLRCTFCRRSPTDPKLTLCLHVYCGQCIRNARKDNKAKSSNLCHFADCTRELDARPSTITIEQVDKLKQKYKSQSSKDKATRTSHHNDAPDEPMEDIAGLVEDEDEAEGTITVAADDEDDRNIMTIEED